MHLRSTILLTGILAIISTSSYGFDDVIENFRNSTATQIDCPAPLIEISNRKTSWLAGYTTWTAKCRGTVYYCVSPGAGEPPKCSAYRDGELE